MSKEDIKIINDKVKYRKALYELIEKNLQSLGAVESDAWKQELNENPDNEIIQRSRSYAINALNTIISTAISYKAEIEKLRDKK